MREAAERDEAIGRAIEAHMRKFRGIVIDEGYRQGEIGEPARKGSKAEEKKRLKDAIRKLKDAMFQEEEESDTELEALRSEIRKLKADSEKRKRDEVDLRKPSPPMDKPAKNRQGWRSIRQPAFSIAGGVEAPGKTDRAEQRFKEKGESSKHGELVRRGRRTEISDSSKKLASASCSAGGKQRFFATVLGELGKLSATALKARCKSKG